MAEKPVMDEQMKNMWGEYFRKLIDDKFLQDILGDTTAMAATQTVTEHLQSNNSAASKKSVGLPPIMSLPTPPVTPQYNSWGSSLKAHYTREMAEDMSVVHGLEMKDLKVAKPKSLSDIILEKVKK